jgi:cytochrome c556
MVMAAAAVAAAATFAYAQGDVINQRQAIMKSNGAQAGVLGAMVQGNSPFDAAAAKAALETIASNMQTFPTLFPEGSNTGDTKAGPAIWTDMAGFQAQAAKLSADATAAAASATSLDALKASFPTVASNCGACHSKYRL